MKTVLLIDPLSTGHHSIYLGKIASAYLAAGWAVVLAVSSSDCDKDYVLELISQAAPDQLLVYPIDNPKIEAAISMRSQFQQERAMRSLMVGVYQSVSLSRKIDYVFLPYVDYFLYAAGLFGSPFSGAKWGALCMRPSFHYQDFDVIAPRVKYSLAKRFLFSRFLKSVNLDSLFTIDPLLKRYVDRVWPDISSKVKYVADPAELDGEMSRESARQVLSIPERAKVILIYGAIDRRKGVESLVHSLLRSPSLNDVCLLVVGKQSEWARDFFCSGNGSELRKKNRLFELNEFVSKTQEQQVLVACDLVWVGYKGHYTMSGVLVLAALVGRQVIATQDGLIGWFAREHKLGPAIDIEVPTQVEQAILKSLSCVENYVVDKSFPDHGWGQLISSVVN